MWYLKRFYEGLKGLDWPNLIFISIQLSEMSGSLRVKVQSCKLLNNKYRIALTQITNTEIFAFIAVTEL